MSRSRHLVDPALLPLLDLFPTVTLSDDNLAQMRERELPMPPPGEEAVTVEVARIDGALTARV